VQETVVHHRLHVASNSRSAAGHKPVGLLP